jgi:dienelactone hydrolase
MNPTSIVQEVTIPTGTADVFADLRIPPRPCGLVIFAHGSGSSRFSPRNRQIAEYLDEHGYATLLLDLLTPEEDMADVDTGEYRFDIPRLARRVEAAVDWAAVHPILGALPIGIFAASTGAAAALMAAAERPVTIVAVVSRGGRPDVAGTRALRRVESPTLLIVGSHDEPVIEMNRVAMRQMHAPVDLQIVSGASHLFEEPGAMKQVALLAARWFDRHLAGVVAVVPERCC